MKNLKILLNKLFPLPLQVSKLWLISFIILCIIGFSDAVYLTIKYFENETPTCSILEGCEQVTTSVYSVILGLPIALLGAFYYLYLLVLTIAYLDTKSDVTLKIASLSTVVGFLFSLYLLILQIFIIKAVCIYCLISSFTSISLFVLGLYIFLKQKLLRLN